MRILFLILFFIINSYNIIYSQNRPIYEYRRISEYIDDIKNIKDQFGVAVSNVGDINGDGIDELAIGSDGYDGGGVNTGAVWLVFFNQDKSIQDIQELSANTGIKNVSNEGWFGNGISGIGDLNHDGVLDIAVGAGYDSNTGFQKGAIHILFMNKNGTVKNNVKIVEGKFGFNTNLGQLASIGGDVSSIPDMDGDGNNEILIGGNRDFTDWNSKSGAVYILFMNSDGSVKKFKKIGDKSSGFNYPLGFESYFGMCVKYIGDLDKDGLPEIAIGAHRMQNDGIIHRGKVFIVSLNSNGDVQKLNVITPHNFNIESNDQSVFFGVSVSGIGDFDMDGIEDMTIGAIGNDDNGLNTGIAYICYMNSNGTIREYVPLIKDSSCLEMQISSESLFGIDSDIIKFPNTKDSIHFFIGAFREYKNSIQSGEVYEVILDSPPSITATGNSTVLCYENQAEFSAVVEGNTTDVFWSEISGNGSIINNPNLLDITVSNIGEGNHVFKVSYSECPKFFDTITLDKINFDQLEIPNVVTGNEDGYNDYFQVPKLIEESAIELTVVDRRGMRAFYSKDYKSNWRPKTPGVYYYIMNVAGCNFTRKGYFQSID